MVRNKKNPVKRPEEISCRSCAFQLELFVAANSSAKESDRLRPEGDGSFMASGGDSDAPSFPASASLETSPNWCLRMVSKPLIMLGPDSRLGFASNRSLCELCEPVGGDSAQFWLL